MRFLFLSLAYQQVVQSGSSSISGAMYAPAVYPQFVDDMQLRSPILQHLGGNMDGAMTEVMSQLMRQMQRGGVDRSGGLFSQMGLRASRGPKSVCTSWQEESRGANKDDLVALKFLKALEASRCPTGVGPGCACIQVIKSAVGGSFDPAVTEPIVLSETASFGGLPGEKRVTATIILAPNTKLEVSLSSLFEKYLIGQGKDTSSPRVHNSIRVNQRKEELTISAGGGMDDVYAFSHSNDNSNSIWIILYLGKSKTMEYGRRLIEGFESTLASRDYVISDAAIVTSEEEEKMERDSEEADADARVRNMETMAKFAMSLICVNENGGR